MQIFCFGDSITWGSRDKEGGWADRLKRHAFEHVEAHPERWIEVYNLGIPGDRTDGLVERFSFETKQRLDEGRDGCVFLFAFGANDAVFVPSEDRFRCSVDQFEINLRKVIQEAEEMSQTVLLLTITPVNEATCIGVDKVRKNEFVEKYNAVIRGLANEKDVQLIDVFKAFMENGHERLLSGDGLHPNAEGHELIFLTLKKYISFPL